MLIEFLLSFLVLLLIFAVAYWIVGSLIPLPDVSRQIALAILVIIFLVCLLGMLFGSIPPMPIFRGLRY